MQLSTLTRTGTLLVASIAFGSNHEIAPVRVVSLRYPCLALKVKLQGTVRVRCRIAEDGSCPDPAIDSGHPLFLREVTENLKLWRFPVLKNGSELRSITIEYRFEIRGVRVPEDDPEACVTFEFPNRVLVTAPFDAKAPCRPVPLE
jgi:TonB family protein